MDLGCGRPYTAGRMQSQRPLPARPASRSLFSITSSQNDKTSAASTASIRDTSAQINHFSRYSGIDADYDAIIPVIMPSDVVATKPGHSRRARRARLRHWSRRSPAGRLPRAEGCILIADLLLRHGTDRAAWKDVPFEKAVPKRSGPYSGQPFKTGRRRGG